MVNISRVKDCPRNMSSVMQMMQLLNFWEVQISCTVLRADYVNCIQYNSHAITGRTVRCCCKFQCVLNYTNALCGFSATARLSCIHQFHSDSWKSRHTTKIVVKVTVITNMWLSYSPKQCHNNWSCLLSTTFGFELCEVSTRPEVRCTRCGWARG